MAETFGTAAISEEKITALIREFFALTPKGIIETLDLRRRFTRHRRLWPLRPQRGWISHGSARIVRMLSARPLASEAAATAEVGAGR